MEKSIRFVGLDVHAETIAVAVAEATGEVRSLGNVDNRPEAIRKLVKKLGPIEQLRFCYEAGPTGYVLYRQLCRMGVDCIVVAPTLIPTKAGDRVKTDRKDAERLARCLRAGDLTAVWVPDAAHEALRDLVRARGSAKDDQRRARQRLKLFLLRHGYRFEGISTRWTESYMEWLRALKLELAAAQATLLDYLHEVDHMTERVKRLEQALDHAVEGASETMRAVVEALQSLRGIAKLSAATIVAEVGSLSRFEHPRQLMGYSGAVPAEHSSGGPGKHRRGGITKTGNAHLRRVLVEAAWAYRFSPRVSKPLRARQKHLSPQVKEISWKAQTRLCGRYRRLIAKGKPPGKVIVAIGRELLGFVWAIGTQVENRTQSQPVA